MITPSPCTLRVGHKTMHELFDDPAAYTGPDLGPGGDLPAIGTLGHTVSACCRFISKGWHRSRAAFARTLTASGSRGGWPPSADDGCLRCPPHGPRRGRHQEADDRVQADPAAISPARAGGGPGRQSRSGVPACAPVTGGTRTGTGRRSSTWSCVSCSRPESRVESPASPELLPTPVSRCRSRGTRDCPVSSDGAPPRAGPEGGRHDPCRRDARDLPG
jgi:hypothetical protein